MLFTKAANFLEEHGQRLCSFERVETQFGEGIEFNYTRTICIIIDAFGLDQIGKMRNVNISASIDAAKITKNLTHICWVKDTVSQESKHGQKVVGLRKGNLPLSSVSAKESTKFQKILLLNPRAVV